MKSGRLIPVIILLACAVAAAYISYSIAFRPPPMHSASGGPPTGFSMPKMGGPPTSKPDKPRNSAETSKTNTEANTAVPKKGETDTKN